MLTRIEETFHRQGAEAQFVDLCHHLAVGYAHAGLEVPYEAWYLGATASRSLPGEPWLREEFDGDECGAAPGQHPSLRWLDATGRSRLDRTHRPGWLGLYPAQGANLWPVQDLDAPRLVATVSGDFVVQTCLELGPQTQVLAGLLVWRDEEHFARLELQLRSLEGERPTVHLEACIGGRFRVLGQGQYERQPGDHAVGAWLRMEREGDELRAWCSPDGEQWTSCGSLRFTPGETEQVGLSAICHWPNAHAWFDSLYIW